MISVISAIGAAVSISPLFDHHQTKRRIASTSDVNPYLAKQIPSSSTGSLFWDCLNYGNSYIDVYYSSRNMVSLNGKLRRPSVEGLSGNKRDKVIECRHLAYDFLTKGSIEDFYKTIESRSDGICSGIVNERDLDNFYHRYSQEAHYFKLKNLIVTLHTIAEDVWKADEETCKNFLCNTMNHTMAFRIKKEGGQLKIIFYDPNETLRHKTFVMAHPDEISALTESDFFDELSLKTYFNNPAKEQEVCLLSPECTDDRDSCRVKAHGKIDNYWLAMHYGHYGHESLDLGLNLGTSQGIYGLAVAIEEGKSESVRAFVQRVLGSTLDENRKVKLLLLGLPESEHTKILNSYVENTLSAQTFEVYKELIVKSDLSSKAKYSLLRAKASYVRLSQ